MRWTDKMEEAAIDLWNAGHSCGHISRQDPFKKKKISRHAIGSKLKRMAEAGDMRIVRRSPSRWGNKKMRLAEAISLLEMAGPFADKPRTVHDIAMIIGHSVDRCRAVLAAMKENQITDPDEILLVANGDTTEARYQTTRSAW